jgi:molybdopterin/thiamine biosynthesis adenylyltransferase
MNDRYSRQILFNGIKKEGQKNLSGSHVVIVGAGALGSASSEMLVRAGVGKVTILDRDYVEYSNLQRQQLYTEADADERIPKAAAAEARLQSINRDVDVEGIIEDVVPETLERYQHADLIIDALDNFATRMIINDTSQKYQIPWIYGACVASYGLSYTILPGEKPCLSCILGTVPTGGDTCDTAGVISPAVQMTASLQTAEALKLLAGNKEALREELIQFDVWTNETRKIGVNRLKDSGCPSCGENPQYPYLQAGNQTRTAVLCGRDTVQIRPPHDVSFDALKRTLAPYSPKMNSYLLQVSLEGKRIVLFKDGRALVHDTSEETEALALYQRYISG